MLFIYFALSNQLTAMGNKLEATQPNTAKLTLKFHKVAQKSERTIGTVQAVYWTDNGRH